MKVTLVCCGCGSRFHRYQYRVFKTNYCSRECRKVCKGFTHSRTHGESKTRLYTTWRSMKSRCHCETSPVFSYYGGRGIEVCREWRHSYEAFRDWAHDNGYRSDLELDRIDNDGDYEPSNCRWADRTLQMRNTRKRVDGKTSKYKGVSWCANVSKWRVQFSRNGRNRHVALFDNEEDAARRYDEEVRKLYGDDCYTNFPRKEGAAF